MESREVRRKTKQTLSLRHRLLSEVVKPSRLRSDAKNCASWPVSCCARSRMISPAGSPNGMAPKIPRNLAIGRWPRKYATSSAGLRRARL
jgi:hypothetical protein